MTASAGGGAVMKLRLIAIHYAARDTHLFEFAREDGGVLPTATPGSHIDLALPNGLIRQYSLVYAGHEPKSYTVGVKRNPKSRGGSSYIHDKLRVGQVLSVSEPRNNFPLDENAPHSVLFAGGIGITPIWCMVQRLAELGRSWELHYSCRSRVDTAFLKALEDFGPVHFNFDEENQGKFLDLAGIVKGAPEGSHFYCCGPKPMLSAYEDATADVPAGHMHIEYFTAKQEVAAEGGFTVELAKTGKSFQIPTGKTILEVLRDADIDVAFSCEQGICGACETKVISGTPDHRDSILSDEEKSQNKTMMICCSGCTSDKLVLDL